MRPHCPSSATTRRPRIPNGQSQCERSNTQHLHAHMIYTNWRIRRARWTPELPGHWFPVLTGAMYQYSFMSSHSKTIKTPNSGPTILNRSTHVIVLDARTGDVVRQEKLAGPGSRASTDERFPCRRDGSGFLPWRLRARQTQHLLTGEQVRSIHRSPRWSLAGRRQ